MQPFLHFASSVHLFIPLCLCLQSFIFLFLLNHDYIYAYPQSFLNPSDHRTTFENKIVEREVEIKIGFLNKILVFVIGCKL